MNDFQKSTLWQDRAYDIILDSQGVEEIENGLSFLATLIVKENGKDVTSCPDAVMFNCKSKRGEEVTYSDIVDSINDGAFKKRYTLELKLLELETIAETFEVFAEDEIDVDEIMKQVRNITKDKFELFSRYLREG